MMLFFHFFGMYFPGKESLKIQEGVRDFWSIPKKGGKTRQGAWGIDTIVTIVWVGGVFAVSFSV